jgi:predicted ferric reductase
MKKISLTKNLDRIGTIGLFLTVLVTPCCFPLFAFVLTAFGLGSAELFGGWTMWIFQAFVLISLIGFFIAYRKHHSIYPLLISMPSAIVIFYSYYFINTDNWTIFLYIGMFGLLVATGLNYYINQKHKITCATCTIIDGKTVELESTITCPNCGHKKKEIMPTDACQFFYECESCKKVLKPNKGDCCVYCSYGTVKCPSMQTNEKCC